LSRSLPQGQSAMGPSLPPPRASILQYTFDACEWDLPRLLEKSVVGPGHWQLISTILATQEIRRITVQSQPEQIVCKTLS
jgi:hypothetical protein